MIGNDKLQTKVSAPKPVMFDLAGTLRRLGGDTNLLADLVKLYNEDSPGLLDRLHYGVKEHRTEEVRHAAHSLRGLAANFGAAILTQSLLRMEEAAAGGHLEEAAVLLDEVGQNSARLQATLAMHQR
jgi:HPt (histidine-containing phosphotransfer) domain-containing protein